tara:strand:+ start:678 stop:929 length:252 start_codon:yes stop_codon:yes gene_type:complete
MFDEVNEQNNIEQLIDLSCLDVADATAICKQIIYDAGEAIRQNGQRIDKVLCIVCGETQISQEAGNEVLNCIKEELRMDHYYV